jgi:hypothetical protein
VKLLIGLVLLLSSCAVLPKWESDWEFDCQWAQNYDRINNMEFLLTGMPFRSNWTANFCNVDPTELQLMLRSKKR